MLMRDTGDEYIFLIDDIQNQEWKSTHIDPPCIQPYLSPQLRRTFDMLNGAKKPVVKSITQSIHLPIIKINRILKLKVYRRQ
jgi:hypothetical protein